MIILNLLPVYITDNGLISAYIVLKMLVFVQWTCKTYVMGFKLFWSAIIGKFMKVSPESVYFLLHESHHMYYFSRMHLFLRKLPRFFKIPRYFFPVDLWIYFLYRPTIFYAAFVEFVISVIIILTFPYHKFHISLPTHRIIKGKKW